MNRPKQINFGTTTETCALTFLKTEFLPFAQVRLCFVTDISRGHTIQQIRADASEVSGLSSFLKVRRILQKLGFGQFVKFRSHGLVVRAAACGARGARFVSSSFP